MNSSEKKIILILGIRGTGKSTKAKELLQSRQRVLIFDTLCEYTSGVICQDLHELAKVWRHLSVANKDFKLIYQPLDYATDFPILCDLVFEHGDMCFLVEEIDTFLEKNPAGLDPSFLNIVQRGRHRGVELIGVTQRPFAIPPILRSQCKELYTFRQFEQRDIAWLGGIIGEAAEQVPNLKQYEYLVFDGNDVKKEITKKPTDAGADMRPLHEQAKMSEESENVLPNLHNEPVEKTQSALDTFFQ